MDTAPRKGKTVREVALESAKACVVQDRAKAYGGPEHNFRSIAVHWSAHLAVRGLLAEAAILTPADVATMMALLKAARLSNNPGHWDSWVDLAGYAACGAEVTYPSRLTETPQQEERN